MSIVFHDPVLTLEMVEELLRAAAPACSPAVLSWLCVTHSNIVAKTARPLVSLPSSAFSGTKRKLDNEIDLDLDAIKSGPPAATPSKVMRIVDDRLVQAGKEKNVVAVYAHAQLSMDGNTAAWGVFVPKTKKSYNGLFGRVSLPEAQFMAAAEAIRIAGEAGATVVMVRTDSDVVVNHMDKTDIVKLPALLDKAAVVNGMRSKYLIRFYLVPLTQNHEAVEAAEDVLLSTGN